MNVNTLASLNGMSPNDSLRAGQKLRLSSASDEPHSSGGKGHSFMYTVHAGDTLVQIARTFQVSVQQILNWNRMSAHGSVQAGQKLLIRVATRRS
jgi:LysM repeat protein